MILNARYVALVPSVTSGIPCLLGVTNAGYFEPMYTRGHPDSWEPEDSEPAEYDILDRRGNAAPWLERKCADSDRHRHGADIEKNLTKG